MKSFPLAFLGASLLSCVAASASAAPAREVVIANEALVASGENLQSNVDRFVQRLETVVGWKKGSTKGVGFTRPREALEYIRKNKVAFAILPIHQFAQSADELKLTPLARAVGLDGRSHSYWAVAKGPAKFTSIEEAPGLRLAMTETYDLQWVKVLFEAEVDPATHFKLMEVPSGTAAVDAVLAGKADVAYLNELDFQRVKDRVGPGQQLAWVYTSGGFPAPPFLAVGKHANKADVKKAAAAIDKTCRAPEGTEPCNLVGLMYFETGAMERYKPIIEKYKVY